MRLLEFLATPLVALGTAIMVVMPSANASAQDPLLDLHERAQTEFQKVHRSMQRLQLIKQSTDPDESRLLLDGSRFIQEKQIREGISDIRGLIEAGDYDRALEGLKGVNQNLEALLQLLLNRDLALESLMDRIEKLEGFRDRVDDLIEKQDDAKDAAAEAEALMKHLENLEKAKREVEKLIDSQKEVRDQANREGMNATPERAAELAEAEKALGSAADSLAKKLEDVEQEAKELKAEDDSAESENKPGEQKDPSDDSKSGKPESGSPNESGSAGKPSKPSASESAQEASKSMGEAGKTLEENQPEKSLEDMDKAVQDLEDAQRELEKLSDEARRKLEKLPFDQLRKKQESTRLSTDKLAQDMENAEESDSENQPTPGKQNVQQAVPKQKAAAGQLKERKPSEAKQEQQDASEDLEDAKQELEDALSQLRQQLEDEVLRALEERFAEMIEQQKALMARTEAIDRMAAVITSNAAVPVKVRNTCAEISTGEFDLGGEASDALKLIQEDGRSAAFPILVEELRDDLNRVGDRIGKFKTSATTQSMQLEIIESMTDLLEALRKTIEERQGGT